MIRKLDLKFHEKSDAEKEKVIMEHLVGEIFVHLLFAGNVSGKFFQIKNLASWPS
jgi:hypothetical protein